MDQTVYDEMTQDEFFEYLRRDLNWLDGFSAGFKGLSVESANLLVSRVDAMRRNINRFLKQKVNK